MLPVHLSTRLLVARKYRETKKKKKNLNSFRNAQPPKFPTFIDCLARHPNLGADTG